MLPVLWHISLLFVSSRIRLSSHNVKRRDPHRQKAFVNALSSSFTVKVARRSETTATAATF